MKAVTTNDSNDSELSSLEQAQLHYQAGRVAFERGQYRQSVEQLEQAVSQINKDSRLGGEMQIWLVTAYQAAGQHAEAIALGDALTQHPDFKIRKQSKRMVYILKAPQLKTRPEWLTEIPDLSRLDEAEQQQAKGQFAAAKSAAPRRPMPKPEPEPIDLSQVNTKDNGFIWLALGAIVLILGGLIWFS